MGEALALLEEIAGRAVRVRTGPPQTGDMRRTLADTSRIESAMGWRATTTLRQGLAAHLAWAEERRGGPGTGSG
jgi:UDP-glucuronate 4-epimerase